MLFLLVDLQETWAKMKEALVMLQMDRQEQM